MDRESERIIRSILKECAACSFLGEEGGSEGTGAERRWIVDPIDGTTNFARGIPEFSISIGLEKSGKLCAGVVVNPVTGDCYYAETGRGAYRNGDVLKVSSPDQYDRPVVIVESGYSSQSIERAGRQIGSLASFAGFRNFGTTALELCYVAQGSADAFVVSEDEIWDYAAGIVIVEEAGGKVTDWTGAPLKPDNSFMAASNGHIHPELISLLAAAGNKI